MARNHPEQSAPGVFVPADFGKTQFEGWLHERMRINVEKRLLTLDLDMILDPFTNRPGPQWWAGEHIGKFLHAATCAWQFTRNEDLKSRLEYAASKLIDTQLESGYLGTYAEEDQFAEGDGLGWNGPVWDVWTHKYCLIGLLTYYRASGEKTALHACMRAADLMHETFVVGKRPMRLASSHMGMAATSVLEPIAILYRLTGEQRYLEFCHYIVNSWEDEDNPYNWKYEDGCQLLSSLLQHGNVHKTANRKAYEMLSNLVGLLELYKVDPDARYLTACENAWKDIVTNRRYITGTTSYFEQFTPDHRLPPGDAVGEGCVTVTWMQLNMGLLELTGALQYADELERTIYNALPAAQSTLTGEVAYFVPLMGRRNFNSHDKGKPPISCCSSSIPRGLAMIPRIVSGCLNDMPVLLQYVPGTHQLLPDFAVQVNGNYPASGDIQIEVQVKKPMTLPFGLRVPAWAQGFEATVDGKCFRPEPGSLLTIEREWSHGDRVRISIPLRIVTVDDGDITTESVAFMRGPQVLATNTEFDSNDGVSHTCVCHQHGEKKTFNLVSFADSGQNRQEYAALHEGIGEMESGSYE